MMAGSSPAFTPIENTSASAVRIVKLAQLWTSLATEPAPIGPTYEA